MKRPAPWQARRIATAKALRALPVCATPGCKGKAMGVLFGDNCMLCPKCRLARNRAQRTAAPRET